MSRAGEVKFRARYTLGFKLAAVRLVKSGQEMSVTELECDGMRSSMSRKGNCWDNAPTESLCGSLKVGRLYGKWFAAQHQAMVEVIDWLTFYKQRRIHFTLGYLSPVRLEEFWYSGQSSEVGSPRR